MDIGTAWNFVVSALLYVSGAAPILIITFLAVAVVVSLVRAAIYGSQGGGE